MGRYRKVEEVKKCKQQIYEQVEKYFEEEDDILINSGQLKFFKGLMIRHLSISTNIKIRAPKKRVYDFLDNRILGSNDEILAMFDPDKNTEAFLHSAYCEGFPYSSTFRPEYGAIPFLLIQKAQSVMENALNAYIRVKKEEEYDIKEEKYLDFLLGVAIYEIMVKEFFWKIKEHILDDPGLARKENLEFDIDELWQEIVACNDPEEKNKKLVMLTDATWQYYEKLCHFTFSINYLGYFVSHQISLYAIFRLIVLIEVVNINVPHDYLRTEEAKREVAEAKFWEKQVEKFLKNGVLFAPIERKKNLGAMYTQLNKIYKDKRIYPHMESGDNFEKYEEDIFPDLMVIRQYLEIIGKNTAENRTVHEEKEMWNLQEKLASPLWSAAEEIAQLQNNVEKSRIEKRKR